MLTLALQNALQARYHEFIDPETGYLYPAVHEFCLTRLFKNNLSKQQWEPILRSWAESGDDLFQELPQEWIDALGGQAFKEQILADLACVAKADVLKSVIASNDIAQVKEFLESTPQDLNRMRLDAYGTTFLMWAARHHNIDMMSLLITFGADVNAVGYGWKTALTEMMRTTDDHSPSMMQLRLNASSEQEKEKVGLLGLEIKNGVAFLMHEGASHHFFFQSGCLPVLETPLMFAACEGLTDVVTCLIDKGADVNTRWISALHICEPQAALEARSVSAEREHQGRTALILAGLYSYYDIGAFLIEAGADIDVIEKRGNYPTTVWGINQSEAWYQLLVEGAQQQDRKRLETLLLGANVDLANQAATAWALQCQAEDEKKQQPPADHKQPRAEQKELGVQAKQHILPLFDHFFNHPDLFEFNLVPAVMDYAKTDVSKAKPPSP